MYITIHDGYDTSNWTSIEGRATKQWDLGYWNTLVQQIKINYPKIEIIQLGAKTGRKIDSVDECLLNKTSITEAFDILKGSRLHIDGDSGLVHAATAMKVICIVMFGPTPDYFFGYKENINLRASTCFDACFWLKDDWMNNCAIGYPTPKCMDQISPFTVLDSVKTILK